MALSPEVRARGANMAILIKDESTAGTAPTAVNYVQVPCISYGVSGSMANEMDNVLSASAGRESVDPSQGPLDVKGPMVVPLDLENCGYWLAAAHGAATVTGTSPDYTHTFTSGSTSLPTRTHIRHLKDMASKAVQTYCMLNTLSISAAPAGKATMSLEFMAQDETFPALIGAPGGTPTRNGFTRFHQRLASLTRNGSTLQNVLSASLTYSNALEGVRTVRADDSLEGIDVGEASLSGELVMRLSSTALIDDAIARTPSSLVIAWTIAANKSLTVTVPRVLLERPSIEVSGPGGIDVRFRWMASAQDGTLPNLCQWVLKNQLASFTA